jgi:Flp pilus assembly protein TadD/4-amino-4-deoxy-L-arabinose transferase-like glycosyltransferase
VRAASVAPSGIRRPLLGSRLLILVAAFAVKAIVLGQLGEHPLLQPHGDLDTTHYIDLARRVANGGPLAIREPFFVSPLYVFFLAAVFRMGGALFAARVVQIVLGTAAVGLLFETTRQWFGDASARVAAALAILTGLFTFYEILILPAALDPFLTASALFAISRAQIDVRARWIAGAGLSSGLLALNRPNALAYLVVAAAGMALASAPHAAIRRALGRAGIFLASAMLVLAPNAVRNYVVSGEWILVSSHGGLNFYIGNNGQADGTYTRLPGITPSIVGQTRDADRMAEAALGRPLSAGEVSRYFYGRGWAWIAAHPSGAIRLFVRKLALLLNRTNVPLNYSYAYYSRDEPTLLRMLVVGPWLVVPLGLVGLFLTTMRRREHGFWVWASFVPVYGLSVAAFFVSDRYRMPLLVPLCAAAGATLGWFAASIRERRTAPIVRLVVAVAAAAALANWNIGADDGRSTEQTRKAVWLVEEGAYDEASRYVEAISPTHRYPGVLRFRVGDALAAAGRTDDAIARYRQALDIDRGQPAIRLALGEALVAKGVPGEAEPHLRAALAAGYQPDVAATWLIRALALEGKQSDALALLADPGFDPSTASAAAASDLGTIALELNAPASAERWLQAAAAQKPEDADVHEKLGVARLMLGKAADAVPPLERACALAPSRVGPRLNLAVAYAQLGRFDDARRNGEHAQRLDPHDARVADFLNRLKE